MEKLADSLGASRTTVDSGSYPHQFQVGKSDKSGSPQLYVAPGTSSAIQYRPGADLEGDRRGEQGFRGPAFEIADFCVVGGLFHLAPQLTGEGYPTQKPKRSLNNFPLGDILSK